MALVEIILLFLAGVVTGIVNTIAGSGTIFSLGTMVFLGGGSSLGIVAAGINTLWKKGAFHWAAMTEGQKLKALNAHCPSPQ